MSRVRFRKLAGDLRGARGRIAAVVIAIALALAGIGTVLGARAVLAPGIADSYARTQPADATLELAAPVDDALLAEVRARAGIARADRRETIRARIRAADRDPWLTLVLFVADDWRGATVATVTPQPGGTWPPPAGALALERVAAPVIGARDRVQVVLPGKPAVALGVSGTVLDAGQAPAWQEHRATAYANADILGELGLDPGLRELHVRFRPAPATRADAEAAAAALAQTLAARGRAVDQIRVPPLREHPHQGLMNAVQLVLLIFGGVLLALGSIVVATLVSGILGRSAREIAVMKAIGATSGQLAAMYAAFVVAIGAVATAVAVPLGYAGARGMIGNVARMMNLADDVATHAPPAWVYAAVAAVGVFVPLAAAAIPIARATRTTVRAGLASDGASRDFARPTRLPLAVRNALRRPARTLVTLGLLVAGGALVVTAANVRRGLAAIGDKLAVARHFELEVRTQRPVDAAALAPIAARARAVEAWSIAEAAIGPAAASGAPAATAPPPTIRTYPDGGHGMFALVAPPEGGSALATYPLLAGRAAAADDEIALGHNALPEAALGARVRVVTAGRTTVFRVVGRVEEVGGGSGFVTPAAFRAATGGLGPRLVRIAGLADAGVAEAALARAGVEYAMPAPRLRTIIDDHVELVVGAVLLVSGVLVLVGLVSLASAMSLAVAERTRELGILRAIGARDRTIAALVIGEALAIATAALVLAIAIALPLTAAVDGAIARGGFLAPPPFAIAAPAIAAWIALVLAGSVAASWLPARRAVRRPVRDALAAL